MRKKSLIIVAGVFVLFIMLVLGSFSKSNAGSLQYTPCPNGCYEGKSECFCHKWAKDEKDAKSGGVTDLNDCFYIDDFPSYY